MNEFQVFAVFGTFIVGALLLAALVFYLDRRDRHRIWETSSSLRHPAE